MPATFFKLTNLFTAIAILAGSLAATDIASAGGGGGGEGGQFQTTIEISDNPGTAPKKEKEAAKQPKKRYPGQAEAEIIQKAGAPRRVVLGVIGGLVGDAACTVVWCIFDKIGGVDTRYTPGDVTRQVLGYKPAKRAPRNQKQEAKHDTENCKKCQAEREAQRRVAEYRAREAAKREAAMKAWREEAKAREELRRRYSGDNYDRHGPAYQMNLGR